MKILTTEQIRQADQYTIIHEPIASLNLMERAASCLAERILQIFPEQDSFAIFCGPGNNGGDGLAIARLLLQQKKQVHIYIPSYGQKFSEDCGVNLNRLKSTGCDSIHFLASGNDFPVIPENILVIDALYGNGLSRPLDGLVKELVQHINRSSSIKVAIDVPSGLMGENNVENDREAIIKADITLTLELPKLAFLFADNTPYTGKWEIVPIGLHKDFTERAETSFEVVTHEMVRSLLKERPSSGHKGTFGHALLIAGSYGKMGAAVLASEGVLRAGAGLLTTRIPRCGYAVLQAAFPEAMADVDETEEHISGRIQQLEKYDAAGVGPGIGTATGTRQMLKLLIQEAQQPIVMDADALNILSEEKTWMEFLPAHTILTPHPGEFDRLAGKHTDGYSRLQSQRKLSQKHGIYIVLKGAYTSVSTPSGDVYFNSTGNSGMATAGSGDVLTGILTGLLAQGYNPFQAALLGVYLHGLAGDLAAQENSEPSLIASDILRMLGKAYRELYFR